jgi:parallel beta-helix repeat protein
MYFAASPSGRSVKVSTVSILASFNSASYITFNNIDFQGGITGVANFGSSDIIFNGCNFTQHGTGIYGVDCSNIQINNGYIINCTSNGVFVEGGGNTVSINGCNTYNCGLIPGMGESGDGKYNGLGVAGDGTNISNNFVHSIGFNGISFMGNNAMVEKNRIDSTCMVKDDGAALYTFTSPGVTASNRSIRFNIITNCIGNSDGALANGDPGGEGAAIYLDGNSNHTTVYNNTCATGNWAGIFNNGNSYNTIYNNTVFDFEYQLLLTQFALPPNYGSSRGLWIGENKLVARTPSQFALHVAISFFDDSPGNLGEYNSNSYSRPISEGATISYKASDNSITNMTLPTWKSTYGQDAASTSSQITTTDASAIRLDYNYASSPFNVSLFSINKEVTGTIYNGVMGLDAYSGKVTVASSSLPIMSTKKAKSASSKVYVNAGKILTITN